MVDTVYYKQNATIVWEISLRYCGNNPVMYVDPTGHAFLVFLAAAVIGFAVSFAASAATQAFSGEEINWGIAAIDGAFGAVSGALSMVPGIGPFFTGVINAGLTAINGVITTGIENDWQFTTGDYVSIGISSAFSGLMSGLARNKFFKQNGTVLFIVWFLYRSDGVECTDNAIKYYRWIFSKKSREIHYDEVTRCLLCGRIWLYKRRYLHGSVIRFFNKGDVILTTELYAKLGLALIYNLGDTKVEVIDDDNMKPRNIDRYFERYFKTGFMSLSYEDQLKLLHYYCKNSRIKTAEEILK